MNTKVPKRIATAIINSLRGGVVPRIGTGYIAVGREAEIKSLLDDAGIIEDGGATFRFIVGKYGSGKSFLLQTIRTYAMDKGFVVADADLSPERRLMGTNGQGLATYRELMNNISTKTKPDGGALSLILDRWINSIQTEVIAKQSLTPDTPEFDRAVEIKIYKVISDIQQMVGGFDFARTISLYCTACRNGDEQTKNAVLQWMKGEYRTKTEIKNALGINAMISDENWYDYIKLFAAFLVRAGYKGMLMLIDELVNIYKIPNAITRQYNYEKILTMYNDTLQGKAKHLGIIMGSTPQCIEDEHRGVFSYQALKSRLQSGRFTDSTAADMLSPIIRLVPLTYEELYVLIEKLAAIHAGLYEYEQKVTQDEMINFIKMEFSRIGASTNITPREIIRDFIEILNILYQNPDKKISQIIGDPAFTMSDTQQTEESIHKEFADFEI